LTKRDSNSPAKTVKAKRANRSPAAPVRTARRQADRSALSDRLLTEAAIDLLVKHGIQGTTLQAVGERAGYSRALATHRFGSKAGLFGHVLKVASTDWLERVQKAVGSLTGIEALYAATDAAEGFVQDRPDELRAMYLLWFLSIDPSAGYTSNIASVHNAQRRDVARWITAGQEAGVVDADVEPMRFAEQYAASMAGIFYQWLANPGMPLSAMFAQLKADLPARLQRQTAARTADPAAKTPAKPSGRTLRKTA